MGHVLEDTSRPCNVSVWSPTETPGEPGGVEWRMEAPRVRVKVGCPQVLTGNAGERLFRRAS